MSDRNSRTQRLLFEQQQHVRTREEAIASGDPDVQQDLVANIEKVSWDWNLRLLIATGVTVLVVILVGLGLYYRTVNQIAPSLLELADEAEARGEWRLAATHLRQYVRLVDDDIETMRRVGDLYYENAETPQDVRRGAQMYAISFVDRDQVVDASLDTRVRHAAMLASVNTKSALSRLDTLIPKDEDETKSRLGKEPALVKAVQLKALLLDRELSAGSVNKEREARDDLIATYELLAFHSPDSVAPRQRLSVLYREKADSIELADSRLAAKLRRKADRLIDEVVATNPNDIDALLRRFEYRRLYVQSPYTDTSDLRRALELDRENPRALLSLAMYMADSKTNESEVSRAQLLTARDFLVESLESLPDQAYVPVALSSIYVRLGDVENAASTLDAAKNKFRNSHEVHTTRAELAIEHGWNDVAEESIKALRGLSRETLQYVFSEGDKLAAAIIHQNTADVLEARLILLSNPSRSQREAAQALLDGIDQPRLQTNRRIDLLENIASLYGELGQKELVIETLGRARATGSISFDSMMLLADFYQRSYEPILAMETYKQVVDRPLDRERAQRAWLRLGTLALEIQSERLALHRDWSDATSAVAALQRISPSSEEAFMLDMYLRLARGVSDSQSVIARLQNAESQFENSVRYWRLCSNAYRQLEEYRLQQAAIERLRALTTVIPKSALAASDKSSIRTEVSEEDTQAVRRLSGTDRGDTAERLRLIREWCSDEPESIAARYAMVELGLDSDNAPVVDEAIDSLRALEPGVGYFWRLAEIRRHLMLFKQGSPDDGLLARKKSEKLAEEYPGQQQVVMLRATAQEMNGDSLAASDSYDIAVKLESTAQAVDGRIRTLVHQRDWASAVQFVETLSLDARALPGRLELVVQVLCHHRRFDDAVAAIRASESRGTPRHEIDYLMAIVRIREGTRESIIAAHDRLVRVVEASPDNLAHWITLFHFEVTKFPELWTLDASRTGLRVMRLMRAHSKDYLPAWSALVIAQVLQSEGRIADADEFYRRAIALTDDSEDIAWISQGMLSKRITRERSEIGSAVAWLAGGDAVRTLSIILALWGGSPDSEFPVTEDDPRAKAILAVSNQDLAGAIVVLEGIHQADRGCGDWLLLTTLHQLEGNGEAAREAYDRCLTDPGIPTESLAQIARYAREAGDNELLQRCLAIGGDRVFDPVESATIDAQIKIAKEEIGDDIVNWIRTRNERLKDATDRDRFLAQMANYLAENSGVDYAIRLKQDVAGVSPNSTEYRLWLCSHKSLARKGEALLPTAILVDPPQVVVEMMYRLMQLRSGSPLDTGTIATSATELLASAPELTPITWTKLASVMEELDRPKLAIRACELALGETTGESLIEHYKVWLRGAYLESATEGESIDRLMRLFGPRPDLMDTQAILMLRAGEYDEVLPITSALQVIDPLNQSYRFNHQLATAASLPPSQRRTAVREISSQLTRAASKPARILMERWGSPETQVSIE